MTERAFAFLYSALSGLEAAAAQLFEGTHPAKRAEELQHRLMLEALAARCGEFRPDVADAVCYQVLGAVQGPEGNREMGRAAFDAVLEPVLVAVLQAMLAAPRDEEHAAVLSRIVEEELHHSGGACEDDATYRAAVAGAVKTLTCPYFSRPLGAILGSGTSALGMRIRHVFRRARRVRGTDPARVFGLCPALRGEAEELAVPAWARQRVRGEFLSPMLQSIEVRKRGLEQPDPAPRTIEAAVAKAAAEVVRDPRFNVVRSGARLYRLADPVVSVRRVAGGDLVSVPLPSHGAERVKVEGFARRIARRERILRKTRAGWWDPAASELPAAEVNAIPVVSGVACTVSSLAHLQSGFLWSGFATPEESEGATYNVLVTGNVPHYGFTLSIACDHRSIDGHVMGEFGLALAARVRQLLGF